MAGRSHARKATTMPEPVPAIALSQMRRQCVEAIRRGQKLDPRRMLATINGERA